MPVFGEPLSDAVDQMKTVARAASRVALMADHHLGYSMPIGGVAAYDGVVSPSGVGYDIACGNKAVRLDVKADAVTRRMNSLMDRVFAEISFGIGRKNPEAVDHVLFDDDPAWDIPAVARFKSLAREQMGTVGGGNHYVDIFADEEGYLWVGVHFGSRGLGHKIASHYIRAGGGKDGMFVEPVLLDAESPLGEEYIAAMRLAGRYAYAGRDYVCGRVAEIIGGRVTDEVHNNHNFAWQETHTGRDYWVIRKGATPAFPGQRCFVGGSMAEAAVILRGVESKESITALYSTVHGAGRIMSRTQAAGKTKRKKGKIIKVTDGKVSREMMENRVAQAGVVLRGGWVDESPHCYKRLSDVLTAHEGTVEALHTLKPLGVAMAGPGVRDPYRD